MAKIFFYFYFIAIVPNDALANEVTLIKEELANKYNSKKALKGPPHITLQAPFRYIDSNEESFTQKLKTFAAKHKGIKVNLEGFNHFLNETIFIEVHENPQLIKLHANLQDFLINEMAFTEDLLRHRDINPHMTIATRDLRPQFDAAWEEFSKRSFRATFNTTGMVLLKWLPPYLL